MIAIGEAWHDNRAGGSVIFDEHGHVRCLDAIERLVLTAALERYRGNAFNTAQVLGIARSTLYRRLNYHELDPERFRIKRETSLAEE